MSSASVAPVAAGAGPVSSEPRPKRFGAGFLGHISGSVSVQTVAEAARLCEDAGMESFWVADQRWMRDAFISLTLAASQTKRISLGTRVTDPFVRHPGLTAVAIASLDEASDGRAVMGIGAGGSGFAQMGIGRERPALAVREAIELIRRLWSSETVEYEGQTVSWKPGALEFAIRPDIPVVIAARGPLLLKLAGEVADGAIVASGTSEGGVAWARDLVAQGEQKAGRPVGSTELLHMTYMTVHSDRALARETVKLGIVGAVSGSHPGYEFLAANGLEIPAALFRYLDDGGRDFARIRELIPDAFVDRLAIAGTAEECADQLAALLEAGIDHPLITPIPAEPDGELEILRQFAERILPRLRTRAG